MLNSIKANDILLMMEHRQNAKLVENLLTPQYNLINSEQLNNFQKDIDLMVVDYNVFGRLKKDITFLKEREEPAYLPLLMVIPQTSKERLKYIQQENRENNIIDDILKVPVEKIILKNRIKNLLQIRKLSLLSQKNYYLLAEESPVGICILHNREIIYANSSFIELSGRERSKVLGASFNDFIEEGFESETKKLLNRESRSPVEICLQGKKEELWVEMRVSEMNYKGKASQLLIISNVTERKKYQQKIEYLSFHDKLTDLYNRAFFEEELQRLNTPRQLPLSIIMGDINNLKLINDAFGHEMGDELLTEMADIIAAQVRQEDIVARLGGDEFAILLPGTDLKTANKVCERIRHACKKSQNKPIELSIALGAACKQRETQDIEEVLNRADARMYRSKITESRSIRNSVLASLENTLLEKSTETAEHAERMEKLVIGFSQRLNFPKDKINELKLLSRLHDIGKVAIPEQILKKPGPLTDEEYEIVKGHAESGYRIVEELPALGSVAEGVLYHHERWDGQGYPRGLAGEKIPYIARVIALVDSFDVMTHDRPYKKALTIKQALQEIKNCAGSQFDPKLARKFIEYIKEEEQGT